MGECSTKTVRLIVRRTGGTLFLLGFATLVGIFVVNSVVQWRVPIDSQPDAVILLAGDGVPVWHYWAGHAYYASAPIAIIGLLLYVAGLKEDE